MATLKAIYDRETGQNPISVETQEHLDALIERVRSYSIGYPRPAIVELTVMDDPWGRARLYAGIGEDRGFVQELWNPPRATQGDPDATGVVVYDLQANDTEIPACQESRVVARSSGTPSGMAAARRAHLPHRRTRVGRCWMISGGLIES